MCGLIGYFTNTFGDVDKNVFIDLMLMSQLRGLDSTGIVQLGLTHGKTRLSVYDHDKDAVCASVFIGERRNQIFLPPAGSSLYGLMGHVRAATKGEVSEKNAHPFLNKSLIGMHNGTMHGYFENSSKYTTDSEAIFHNIDLYGTEKGLKTCNYANKSAYALQFYNHIDGTINFIRNTERPLWLGISKTQKSYVVASEKEFLKYVENKYTLQFSRLFLLQPDVLYTLHKLEGNGYNFTEKKLDVRAPIIKTTAHVMGHGHGQTQTFLPANTTGGTHYNYQSGPKPTVKVGKHTWTPPGVQITPPPIPKEESSGVIKFPAKERLAAKQKELDDSFGPFADKTEPVVVGHAPYLGVDATTWFGLVASGCNYCQSVPAWEERGYCTWENDETFYCPECTRDPALQHYIIQDYYNRVYH